MSEYDVHSRIAACDCRVDSSAELISVGERV
jgi:hypothetical protein